jgi:hypothetical protein
VKGIGEVHIERVRDAKPLVTILLPRDGIRVNTMDARWSADSSTVIVLLERRQTYDVSGYRKDDSERFVRFDIALPDVSKSFRLDQEQSGQRAGETAYLGKWDGSGFRLLTKQRMRKQNGTIVCAGLAFSVIPRGTSSWIKEVSKVGPFDEDTFDAALEKWRRTR